MYATPCPAFYWRWAQSVLEAGKREAGKFLLREGGWCLKKDPMEK